jgi:CMP-N-acetylneuraminic acid synthetase
MIDVVVHPLAELDARGWYYEVACLLQPSTPFRQPGLIDHCIEELECSGADSIVTVVEVPAEHNPHCVYFAGPDGSLLLSTGETDPVTRRQKLPAAFCREGSVYLSYRDTIMEGRSLYGQRTVGVLVNPETTVNIDLEADWERATSLLATVAWRP